MNKLLLVAAGAAGYVLGARAGRARYEQIRQHSAEVWKSGPVQRGVDDVTAAAKQGAGAAGSKIADAAKQAGSAVVDRVSGDDEAPSSSVDDLLADDAAATPDPAAPAPGSESGPLPPTTPTAPASPPTAGDLDPNKNL
ncbi:hypothetical protein [Aeromicrobium halocynthiae]|uniref:hypothetical protein n=1 Tax=Aeromicrobium halocynthiae TaxID=560557 RepID=UPI0031E1784E